MDSKEEEEKEKDQRGVSGMTTPTSMTTNTTTTTTCGLTTMHPTTSKTRTRTVLILLPCFLVGVTVVALWFLPSSYYHEFLHPLVSSSSAAAAAAASSTTKTMRGTPSVTGVVRSNDNDNNDINNNKKNRHAPPVPKALLELGIYDAHTDFRNEQGISPTGWEEESTSTSTHTDNDNDHDHTDHEHDGGTTWGPCHFFKSSAAVSSIPWQDRRRHIDNNNNNNTSHGNNNSTGNNNNNSNQNDTTEYYRNADVDDFDYHRRPATTTKKNNDGWCRPGFLIIGGGKCGTSSLYHYLVGHPRVVPALEKQIHYFKYVNLAATSGNSGRGRPLEWYYGHFPTPQSFFEHGALLTGEASPGYLPYPEVAITVKNIWKKSNNDQKHNPKSRSRRNLASASASSSSSTTTIVTVTDPQPPKIIMVGREPIDRMYSSYRYNYVVPTIQRLRTKGHPHLKSVRYKSSSSTSTTSTSSPSLFELHHPDDEYYIPYLYTLEDLVRAELQQLKACLDDWGADKTYEKFKHTTAYNQEIINRRQQEQPFIDLDGVCYGTSINRTVYRAQWSVLQMTQATTHKVLFNTNLHLTQALIGRSLYTFPLEWWYQQFPKEGEITFVCTEEMTNNNNNNNSSSSSSSVMDQLAVRLGLPTYDGFAQVLEEGAYNVGGHRGYDTATSWEDIQSGTTTTTTTTTTTVNNKTVTTTPNINTNNNDEDNGGGEVGEQQQKQQIPLPEDLYQELKEFITPLNERLFALTGKRCNW